MAEDKFSIETDVGRQLLKVRMRGHWSIETVDSYKKALVAAVDAMYAAGCTPGSIVALVDLQEGSAQGRTSSLATRIASEDRTLRRSVSRRWSEALCLDARSSA